MRVSGILGLAMLAAGCAGPRPDPPAAAAVAPPAAWRDPVAGSSTIAPQWWEGFGDSVLIALVTRALAQNDDIAIAAARVEEARAQFRFAQGQQLPSLAAGIGGGPQRTVSAFGLGLDQTAGQVQLQASYDLDLFGRLRNATAATRATLLASSASAATVRLAVVSATVSGYITLCALDQRLAILRQTLDARADSLKVARRRAEAGYATALELRQAEAEYHATEQLIPAAELAIRRQEDGLSLLIGEAPQAFDRGRGLDKLIPLVTPASLPSDLLRQRPDIVQAEQQLVAADRSLDSARAAFMPQIQLSATGGYVASTLLGDPIGIFTLGGSVLAPLFQGGRLRAQADVAAARRDQAAFAYRRATLGAFRDVEDALAAISRTAEQERALSAQRDALAAALAQATNRYRAGYASYLDQLDAQRGLLAAELTLVQARSDHLLAQIALYQGLGGGWSSAPLTASR